MGTILHKTNSDSDAWNALSRYIVGLYLCEISGAMIVLISHQSL